MAVRLNKLCVASEFRMNHTLGGGVCIRNLFKGQCS